MSSRVATSATPDEPNGPAITWTSGANVRTVTYHASQFKTNERPPMTSEKMTIDVEQQDTFTAVETCLIQHRNGKNRTVGDSVWYMDHSGPRRSIPRATALEILRLYGYTINEIKPKDYIKIDPPEWGCLHESGIVYLFDSEQKARAYHRTYYSGSDVKLVRIRREKGTP